MLIDIPKINKGEFKWITDTFLGCDVPESLRSDQDFLNACHKEADEFYYPAIYKLGNGIYTTHLIEDVIKEYFGTNVIIYNCDCDYDEPVKYGTADDIDQILENADIKKWFIDSENKYILGIRIFHKEDQEPIGGFRKHKWGPYIGTKSKGYEYLYNEPDMEYIICYHFYKIL